MIFPVTEIFRPVRLITPMLLAEIGLDTLIWLPVEVRLRLLPLMNEAELASVIVPADPLVKFTVKWLTKLADEVRKLNEEFEIVPLLSFTNIEARPDV